MNKLGKHLTIILTEMCKRVNVKFEDVDFKEKEWFMKHSWTEEEQDDFKKWLVDYWYSNKEARKEMLSSGGIRRTKKKLKDIAAWFLLDYGWKIK